MTIRTYQRSTDEGARARATFIAVVATRRNLDWGARSHHTCFGSVTRRGPPFGRGAAMAAATVFEKDMGKSGNGMAAPGDQAKLRHVADFDYIIVGAGSAGCVLADRLSASGRDRVLVLEAGGTDQRLWIKLPIGYGRSFADARVNWKYQTLAIPGLNHRTMYWPRGRVVGGSSSINALVYCRGMPADFDDWRDLGNTGWGWEDVRPYFEKSERRVDAQGRAAQDGPLDVKDVTPFLHPMGKNWLDAAAELRLPVTDDFNGAQPEGFGCYQVTIRNGRRWSA